MSRAFSALAAGGLLFGLLAAGPVAMAAEQGSTSGPAAGSPVKPGTAAQKENMAGQSGTSQSSGTQAAGGAVGAGAPGVTAKPDTQGGPSAKEASGMPKTGETTNR